MLKDLKKKRRGESRVEGDLATWGFFFFFVADFLLLVFLCSFFIFTFDFFIG